MAPNLYFVLYSMKVELQKFQKCFQFLIWLKAAIVNFWLMSLIFYLFISGILKLKIYSMHQVDIRVVWMYTCLILL